MLRLGLVLTIAGAAGARDVDLFARLTAPNLAKPYAEKPRYN